MTYRLITIGLLVLLASGCSSRPIADGSGSQSILEIRQKKAQDHYLSGALLDYEQDYKSAIDKYTLALEYDTSSAEIRKALGRDYRRTGNLDRAIYHLRRSYDRNPQDEETLYLLGESYYDIKQYERAEIYFRELNLLMPYNREVHSRLIFLYSYLGKSADLIELRERLVDVYGYENEHSFQLVRIYMQFNNLHYLQVV